MWSGIGDEVELRAHDIKVVQGLPGVGANLRDHVSFGATDNRLAFLALLSRP